MNKFASYGNGNIVHGSYVNLSFCSKDLSTMYNTDNLIPISSFMM